MDEPFKHLTFDEIVQEMIRIRLTNVGPMEISSASVDHLAPTRRPVASWSVLGLAARSLLA